MKKLLKKKLIQDIALETGIAPAFIEKDWHAVQLLKILSSFQGDKNVQLVFSGGTSLSKGYDLIKRFSEDLDFVLLADFPLSVGQRRSFRGEILDAITCSEVFTIDADAVQRGDSHRFFKAPIVYQKVFEDASLRPHLQLEMTFFDLKLPPEQRQIQSIIAKVTKEEPELKILCVSPLETAGDKLSALTWRVLVRDREAPNDDPTIIRHLHDLACLESTIVKGQDAFVKSATQSLELDRSRRGGEIIAALPIEDRLLQALNKLQNDGHYRKEYTLFVENMSYADENERINFNEALRALERIIKAYTNGKPLII